MLETLIVVLWNGILQAVLKMLNEIGSVENIPDFLEGVKSRFVSGSNFRRTDNGFSFSELLHSAIFNIFLERGSLYKLHIEILRLCY